MHTKYLVGGNSVNGNRVNSRRDLEKCNRKIM